MDEEFETRLTADIPLNSLVEISELIAGISRRLCSGCGDFPKATCLDQVLPSRKTVVKMFPEDDQTDEEEPHSAPYEPLSKRVKWLSLNDELKKTTADDYVHCSEDLSCPTTCRSKVQHEAVADSESPEDVYGQRKSECSIKIIFQECTNENRTDHVTTNNPFLDIILEQLEHLKEAVYDTTEYLYTVQSNLRTRNRNQSSLGEEDLLGMNIKHKSMLIMDEILFTVSVVINSHREATEMAIANLEDIADSASSEDSVSPERDAAIKIQSEKDEDGCDHVTTNDSLQDITPGYPSLAKKDHDEKAVKLESLLSIMDEIIDTMDTVAKEHQLTLEMAIAKLKCKHIKEMDNDSELLNEITDLERCQASFISFQSQFSERFLEYIILRDGLKEAVKFNNSLISYKKTEI